MRTVCHACAAEVGTHERIGPRDTCARCGVDLHSCAELDRVFRRR
jgi:rRNA maturation endonuclease Nob1